MRPVSQSHRHSFFEACANTLAGFLLSMAAVAWLFPLIGVRMSLAENFGATTLMTFISIARSYALRRLFNRWHA